MSSNVTVPELPKTPLALAALDYTKRIEEEHLFNHSVRSYLFSQVVADAQGLVADEDYDHEVLFLSVILHDIGLTDEGNGDQRFEVDGADLAVRFLQENGLGDERAEIVWDAIALHTSAGIASRKRAEVALTSAGIAIDVFGPGDADLDPEIGLALHRAWPRLGLGRNAPRIIAEQVRANPAKAPLYSAPAGVARDILGMTFPTWQELQCACPWEE
jgi:HD domain